MKKTAVLANIHSNWPALRAVIEDAQRQGVERFVCLGGIVAGGPFPVECLRWVMKHCEWSFGGSFDRALVDTDHILFGSSRLCMNETLRWNLSQIKMSWLRFYYSSFVQSLGIEMRDGHTKFQYGSPLEPQMGYFPSAILSVGTTSTQHDADKQFDCLDPDLRLLLCGHLGVPCRVDRDGTVTHVSGEGLTHFQVNDSKLLCLNVGTVGLPRDRDNRACYVICDGLSVEYRRCSYDLTPLIDGFKNRAKHLSERCLEFMIKRHLEGE